MSSNGHPTPPPPILLSIAGFDPSCGAGLAADLKTFAAYGCYGVAAITSVTVQNTQGVEAVHNTPSAELREQLDVLAKDCEIAAVKIGMLGSAEAARAVAAFLKRYQPQHVVLDPVLKSSSGADLISKDGLQILKDRLLAMASVVTPNIDEAAALTGLRVDNVEEMGVAALRLRQSGARNVIITGGHLDPPTDLISAESSKGAVTLAGAKIVSPSTHGTGCAFSTALACNLALGQNLVNAAKAAKHYVESSLKKAPAMGRGTGPVV